LRAEEEGCYCIGRVGNVDCDYRDQVTLMDLLFLIDHLFISECRLPSREEANCNGDSEGRVTLGDLSALIDHFFVSGQDLPFCQRAYNSPPVTALVDFVIDKDYINAEGPGRDRTGLPAVWSATDIIDHPYDEIDYQYEYRLYGPYDDALIAIVTDSFRTPVFRTFDGRMFYMNNTGAELYVCDTSYDGGVESIECDTILVDTLTASNDYGIIDTLVRFEDTDFVNSPMFNRTAVHSGGWIDDTTATLFDVFNVFPSDTTWKANFIFWVRAREKDDTLAVDPTPEFAFCKIIDPHFERDVLVTNWSASADENSVHYSNVKAYWGEAIRAWIDRTGRGGIVDFDIDRDFWRATTSGAFADFQATTLHYKVIIVCQDGAVAGPWAKYPFGKEMIFSAMASGVNVWAATRVPLGTFSYGSMGGDQIASEDYRYYFGLEQYAYSGWSGYLLRSGGTDRVEDFVGTLSPDSAMWPPLDVDTARLHSLYRWDAPAVWAPEIAALPEVDWMIRSYDTEIIYLYKSKYGAVHPIHEDLSFQGRPVMFRLDRGLFRSVQSLFTPIAIEQTTAQVMVDSVLDWLYDGSTDTRIAGRPEGNPSLTREE